MIGIVFTAFFAMGLVLRSFFPSNIDLKTIMLGNLLGISDGDAIQCLIIGGISLGVVVLKWKDLMLFCFDANHARSLGLNTKALHWIFLTLLSLTTVAALQAVGACLVVAMLITPGATAYLLTDRLNALDRGHPRGGHLRRGYRRQLVCEGIVRWDHCGLANVSFYHSRALCAEIWGSWTTVEPGEDGISKRLTYLMDTIFHFLTDPFQYPFMVRALTIGILRAWFVRLCPAS